MDLLIPHSWLKKLLDTKASAEQIVKYLSLCGPSIEKTTKTTDGDYIFNVEVTTNRVDSASVIGIAREASAILPRFGIKAKLKKQKSKLNNFRFVKKVKYLDVKIDEKICPRFTAVLIKNVTIKDSPKEIKSLLEKVGVRPINNIVDVSNFIMHELGQPVHTFDYDKIQDHKMILRSSTKSELITTLDGKTFKLDGGDIVIENNNKLIDLCGIMGGENSAIDERTKNVLLFVQNYEPSRIRKTSMNLGLRTEAAVLFEKGLDSENVLPAILSTIKMIEELSGGIAEKEILDIYPNPHTEKIIKTTEEQINKIIGIEINIKDITNYMTSLGFETKQQGDTLLFNVPSWRGEDINIKEDIAEEIARIYGYHNLPCVLMDGALPTQKYNLEFTIEKIIKQTLVSLGAIEIYNLSLTDNGILKLKNPLGEDTKYLRNNLINSLIQNIKNNPQENNIHIFEISNIFVPDEKLMLGGIIKGGNYRNNKGIIEALLEELQIEYSIKTEDGKDYLPNQRLEIYSQKEIIGEYGNLENGLFTYEFDVQKLISSKKISKKYQEISKYPSQIEDLTLIIPEKTYIGEVIDTINSACLRRQVNELINKIELVDIYENNFTFNIEYHDPNKTLTDKEVEVIRNKILSSLKSKFGITAKELGMGKNPTKY